MSQGNGATLSLDGYAVVGLAYEQLTGTFSAGDRIPVTSVKHVIDDLITTFELPDTSSPAIMREMETQGLLKRDQREYRLR